MESVLIIEDDEYVRQMLKQTFERAGYEVATASNGRVGVQMYESQPFSVVITDIIMPDMEGVETITYLKKRNPDVKIIAISGGGRNNPQSYLSLAERLGAAFTFTKPVDRQELLEAVQGLAA